MTEASASDGMETLMTVPFNIASRRPVLSVPSGLARTGVPGPSVVGPTWLEAPDRRPSL